jgi:hypothetical protein
MNYNDAKIAMRVLNLDGGEGSGVKGHTTEHTSGWSEAVELGHKDTVASTQRHLRSAKAEQARAFPGSAYHAETVSMYTRLLQEHKTALKAYQKLRPKSVPG